jgi:hypothetical protein
MLPTLVERLNEVGKDIFCIPTASAQADESIGNARGKDGRWTTFEFGERILEVRPGRIVEAAIGIGR